MRYSLIILLILSPLVLISQSEDLIHKHIAQIVEDQETDIHYDLLYEQLERLLNFPVDLNGDKLEDLVKTYLITEYQLFQLKQYRKEMQGFVAIEELQFIKGFNEQRIALLRPFITLKQSTTRSKPSFKHLKHRILTDISFPLEKMIGADNADDSTFIARPNSYFLGKNYKFKTRYTFDNKHIRGGLIIEKDAGEVFLKNKYTHLTDSILNTNPSLADHSSYFIQLSDWKWVQKAVIGDYHLSFGQGLGLWTGIGFSKTSDASLVKRSGNGIRGSASSDENDHMRGIAVSIGSPRLKFDVFYSNKNRDATLQESDSLYASSLLTNGLHRTVNELNKKDVINEKVIGLHTNIQYRSLKLGIGYYSQHFDLPIIPTGNIFNKYRFSGQKNSILFSHFQYIHNRSMIYGEVSRSANKAFAFMIGLDQTIEDILKLSFNYRKYSKSFQNYYANAFSEQSNIQNESGLYVGISLTISKSLTLNAYTDHYHFPWLKIYQYSPIKGSEQLVQLNYKISHNSICYFRFKTESRPQSFSLENEYFKQDHLVRTTKSRFQFATIISKNIEITSRIEWSIYTAVSEKQYGILFYQDLRYNSDNDRIKIWFRYAGFSTSDYGTRIYTYENDLLYHFSIPAFYGKGNRFYCMLKYQIKNNLSLGLKYSITKYTDRETIGSGVSEIEGNKRSELKLQFNYRI